MCAISTVRNACKSVQNKNVELKLVPLCFYLLEHKVIQTDCAKSIIAVHEIINEYPVNYVHMIESNRDFSLNYVVPATTFVVPSLSYSDCLKKNAGEINHKTKPCHNTQTVCNNKLVTVPSKLRQIKIVPISVYIMQLKLTENGNRRASKYWIAPRKCQQSCKPLHISNLSIYLNKNKLSVPNDNLQKSSVSKLNSFKTLTKNRFDVLQDLDNLDNYTLLSDDVNCPTSKHTETRNNVDCSLRSKSAASESVKNIPGGTDSTNYPTINNAYTSNMFTTGGANTKTTLHSRLHSPFKVCMGNAQSLGNKIPTMASYLVDHDLDMCLIVESWLTDQDKTKIGNLEKEGYHTKITPREERKGGGIICIYKKELNIIKTAPPFPIKTMEFMEVLLTYQSKKIRFVTIYRPNPSQKNRYTMSDFYIEFATLMSHYNLSKDEIIISGDFNFHVNKPNDPDAKKFIDILTTFNLVQHITQSTHILGNTLDLLITRSPSTLTNHKVDFQISDHSTILFDLNIGKTECPKKILNFRKLKAINIDEFKKDIKQLSDNSAIIDSLSDLVDFYVELNRILDNHAPEQLRLVALRKPTPWTSQDIKPEKQEIRRLER
jgi:exonuclease III